MLLLLSTTTNNLIFRSESCFRLLPLRRHQPATVRVLTALAKRGLKIRRTCETGVGDSQIAAAAAAAGAAEEKNPGGLLSCGAERFRGASRAWWDSRQRLKTSS